MQTAGGVTLRCQGNTVLVTGFTPGCGRAMVARLVEQGLNVVGRGRSRRENENLE